MQAILWRFTRINVLLVLTISFGLGQRVPAEAWAFDKEYSKWSEVLENFVSNGLVDYRNIKKSPEALDAFLEDAKAVTRGEYDNWLTEAKIAFWINLYNAEVVRTVLWKYPFPTHPLRREGLSLRRFLYPKSSIMQIPDAFKKKTVETLGRKFSLNKIRDNVLRKEFGDPRIHFALVNASLGSPSLRGEPYLATKLDAQLEEQAGNFLEKTENCRYDAAEETLYLSSLLKTFKKDFDKSGGVLSFVRKYAPRETAEVISDETPIEWNDFDWTLNQK